MSDAEQREQSGDIKAAVRQRFDPVAANYSSSPVHALGADLARLVEAAELRGTEQVLDVGCGPGHTALACAPHAAAVTALDFSSEMLEQGRQLAAARGIVNVTFQHGDAEQLPWSEPRFDRVVSRYSGHHWPQPGRALAEFRRVVRSDGRLLLADVVAPVEPGLDTFLNAVELLRDHSHVRDHSIHQWQELFAAAGFALAVAHTWPIFLEFESWHRRIAAPPQHVEMIRALMDGAPQEVRLAFQIQPDYSFTIQGALLVGTPLP